MSQVLDLPVVPTPILGPAPATSGGQDVLVPEPRGPLAADDVVVVFEDNAPVAGGSFHLSAARPTLPLEADGHRTADLTGIWTVAGRGRRERARRAIAALEGNAALAGYARLRVLVDAHRTDVVALLRASWFTPTDGRPAATAGGTTGATPGQVELEKWLLPA
ncbi:hypothetical protein KIN34_09505 [Cellulomonas sp. DKR-3]|uniref:Uncharacterized protein n=1 Tax=Cellulomonas fulva TaxID=2835530 RepID=A0ABS5TZI6_9CELL|nr:hypothetical protein [Cellulomonas fulva]MBT0994521.1 hypothetical protein [Cellulomonas fulva]